jgi:hypothetical protein
MPGVVPGCLIPGAEALDVSAALRLRTHDSSNIDRSIVFIIISF